VTKYPAIVGRGGITRGQAQRIGFGESSVTATNGLKIRRSTCEVCKQVLISDELMGQGVGHMYRQRAEHRTDHYLGKHPNDALLKAS